jgi:NO-binding membrane sensor protein with MHYT domain
MPVQHEPWLVVLSVIVAIQGAYVGLSIVTQVGVAVGLKRRLLLATAAVSFAVAIWAMHFVGMLAAHFSFPVDYLVFPTLLSFLVCIIAVGAAIFAVSAGPLTKTRLAASAVLMGGGIASMHYIGMTALDASVQMEYAPLLVVASVIVAIVASGLALWLACGRGGRVPRFVSATIFGMAISGMHYTAMAGLSTYLCKTPSVNAPALSPDLLAIVVAIVAFLVSSIFLLTLVPDPQERPMLEPGLRPAPAGGIDWSVMGEMTGSGGRAYAPLGGAGLPPRQPAHHLPIERAGHSGMVAIDKIVAVHANAHYTYIFNGESTQFCPLSIGEVESRLDSRRFMRVHRSHIVNIDRVVRLKRAGDNGILQLAGEDRPTVPVSRSRFGWLKSKLDQKAQPSLSDVAE